MAPLRLDQVVLTGEFVHEVLQARRGNTSKGKKDVDSVLGAVRWLSMLDLWEGAQSHSAQATDILRPKGRVDGQHSRLQDIPETLMAWAARYMATHTAPEDGS